jgi:glycosyltransferase 2 family protein
LVPRAGEIARSTYHSKYQQVLFEKSLATVILDRLTDFIGLSFVLLLTVLLQFNIFYNYLTQTIKFDIKFISIILLACVALAWVVRKIFSQSIIRENERIRNFYSALKSIKRVNDFKLLIIYTAIIWILYYLMHQFCIYSFPETMELPPVVGLTILSFGAFGILLPSPGGIGSYHYFIIIALSFYGLEEKDGLSFSNINFLLLYLTNILMGVIAFISIPIYNRQIHS